MVVASTAHKDTLIMPFGLVQLDQDVTEKENDMRDDIWIVMIDGEIRLEDVPWAMAKEFCQAEKAQSPMCSVHIQRSPHAYH